MKMVGLKKVMNIKKVISFSHYCFPFYSIQDLIENIYKIICFGLHFYLGVKIKLFIKILTLEF